MKKFFYVVLVNLAAIWIAAYFVDGFEISGDIKNLLILSLVFSLLNVFIRPILKIVFSPIIFITFGLAIVFVNASILYFLDFLSDDINITKLSSLLYSTLVISIVNILINFIKKRI